MCVAPPPPASPNDRAASPIIGLPVVLAITVVLAVVVGPLTAGIASLRDESPTASFGVSTGDAPQGAVDATWHDDGVDAGDTYRVTEPVAPAR